MKLSRRYSRNIVNNLSFYAGTAILTILIGVVVIATSSSAKTGKEVMADFIDENRVEDAQIYTMSPIPDEDIQALELEYNLEIEEMAYHDEVYQDYTLKILRANEKINLYHVTDGNDISTDSEMLISENFANANDLSIGDEVEVEGKNFRIVGFMVRVDYLFMLKDPSDAYTDYDAFGVAVISETAFAELEDNVSYYSVRYHEDNLIEFRKNVHEHYLITSYLAASSNTRIYGYEKQAETLDMVATGLTPFLFILVMLIIALILGRKLDSEQHQIGTLIALGYRKKELVRHYAVYPMIPGAIGGILGVGAGILGSYPICAFYFSIYEKLPYSLRLTWVSIVVTLIFPTLFYCLVAVYVVRKMLKKNAIEMLRNIDKNTQKNKSNVTRMAFANSKMSFRKKYQLRSIMRHASRSVVVIIGIIGATTFALIGFAIKDAIDSLVDSATESVPYEYIYYMNKVDFEVPKDAESALVLNFEATNSTALFQMWGVNENTRYLDLVTDTGEDMAYGDYYMTNAGAKAYGISEGDTFKFRNIITTEEFEIEISGIIDDNTNVAIYTSHDNVARFGGYGLEDNNVLISDNRLNISARTYTKVSSRSDLRESIESVVNMYYASAYMVIGFGFAIGMLVMYMITNMIIQENVMNISMLKILGYKPKEINAMVLHTNTALIPIGMVLAVPVTLGICIMSFAKSVESMGMYFPVALKPISYIIGFVVIALSYEISLLLLRAKTEKIDMVECLKESNE
jgi:putative ABC transport system permease protein